MISINLVEQVFSQKIRKKQAQLDSIVTFENC